MNLFELVHKEDCLLNLEVNSKLEVLDKMVTTLANNHNLDKNKILEKVLERENQLSTGLGEGVAIPHCKSNCLDKLYICVATTKNEIDFDALDEKPCKLFFLVLAPENKSSLHVEALALIANLVKSKINKRLIISSSTQEELYESLID